MTDVLELSDNDLKAIIIKMLSGAFMGMLGTSEQKTKTKKSLKRNRRYKGEPDGNCRIKTCND